MIVTHQDIRALGYCNAGAREFFKRHNLDWQLFMQHGVEADVLLAIDDEMAREAVAQANRRAGEEE